MARAGTPLTTRARPIRARFLRRVWWIYPTAAIILGAMLAGPVLLWPQLTLPAIVVVGTLLGYLVGDTLTNDGARNLRDGAAGEENTARVLKRLRRRGSRVEHNVPLAGRDIDHVAIGPGGAVAIESKYTNAEWTVTSQGIVETTLNGGRRPVPWPVTQAVRAARDLRLVALTARVRRLPVLPVVVVWGPRVAAVDGGARWVGDVLVAVGRQWKQWIDVFDGASLAPHLVDDVWNAVVTRKREHRDDDRRLAPAA